MKLRIIKLIDLVKAGTILDNTAKEVAEFANDVEEMLVIKNKRYKNNNKMLILYISASYLM